MSILMSERCVVRTTSISPKRLALGVALCVLGLSAGGCKPRPCGPDEIKEGKTYEATVLAPYSESGAYPGMDPVGRGAESCGGIDGIDVGTTVAIQMTGRGNTADNCRPALGRLVQVPSSVTVIKTGAPTGSPSSLLAGISSVSVNGCKGWYVLEYFQADHENADIFSEPELGKEPPVVMRRDFRPDQDSAGNCKPCEDYFVVRLKQPAP
jgi:hypothetical protein